MDRRNILIVAVIAASALLISLIGWAIVLGQTNKTPIEASGNATAIDIVATTEPIAINGNNVTEGGQIIGDATNIIKFIAEDTSAFKIPDTNGPVAAELTKGTSVTVTKHSTKGWCEIQHNNNIMYIDSKYLTEEIIEKDPAIVIEENVEETATEEYSEPKYSEDGVYLIVNEEIRAEGDVWLHVAPKTSSEKVVVLGRGMTATRIGVGLNGWSQILYNDEVLYVTTYWVSPTKPPKYDDVKEFVKLTESANIRESSSINSKKIAALPNGVELVRIGIGRNGWSKIIYNGQIRYIYSLYITPIDREVTEKDLITKN